MKKKSLTLTVGVVIILLGILLVTDQVVAKKGGISPLDMVWEAIADLQGQINSLVTPTALHLVDDDGQDLGILVDAPDPLSHRANNYHVFWPDLDILIRISGVEVKARNRTLYFDEEDCAGTPFVDGVLQSQRLHRNDTGYTPFFVGVENDTPTNLNSSSHTATSSPPIPNNCLNAETNLPTAYHIQEVTLPVTEPLALPLRVVEQ